MKRKLRQRLQLLDFLKKVMSEKAALAAFFCVLLMKIHIKDESKFMNTGVFYKTPYKEELL